MKVKTLRFLKEMGIDVWVERPSSENSRADQKAHFLFLNYHSVGFCCSLDPEKQRTLPNVLRFLDDLAFVFSLRKLSPHIGELNWPLSSNPDYDPQEVVRQIVSALPAKVIFFGDRFANLIFDSEEKKFRAKYKVKSNQFFFADDVFSYLGNPEAKKDLWITMGKEGLINGY